MNRKKCKAVAVAAAVFAAALVWQMSAYASEDAKQSDREVLADTESMAVGKPEDGGFIYFRKDPGVDLDDVSIQVKRITEGEEISKFKVDSESAACILEYKLMQNGEEWHPDTRMEIGLDLPDEMLGYYKEVYRIEKDGLLRELIWENASYPGHKNTGAQVWQECGVIDYALGRYFVVAPYKFGDANGDGEISAEDALEVLEMAVDLKDYGACKKFTSDVTGDYILDARDALEILQYVVKLDMSFPAWDKIPQ